MSNSDCLMNFTMLRYVVPFYHFVFVPPKNIRMENGHLL